MSEQVSGGDYGGLASGAAESRSGIVARIGVVSTPIVAQLGEDQRRNLRRARAEVVLCGAVVSGGSACAMAVTC